MQAESPEEFELNTLQSCLKLIESSDSNKYPYQYLKYFATAILLFILLYFLHGNNILPPYWLYSIAILGGVFMGFSAVMVRSIKQSSLIHQYINVDAMKKRITELRM